MSTPLWRKSSRSDTSGNECVEVAQLPGNIGIRDSKNPTGGHLTLESARFAGLVARVKRDELSI
ncbi:MAG: hypothetical protein JWL97_3857 [Gemmatimonadales bacterium]|nr:hypothetical protein [Gemmatimonadales bacterium]